MDIYSASYFLVRFSVRNSGTIGISGVNLGGEGKTVFQFQLLLSTAVTNN
jgi:hypothetical protein